MKRSRRKGGESRPDGDSSDRVSIKAPRPRLQTDRLIIAFHRNRRGNWSVRTVHSIAGDVARKRERHRTFCMHLRREFDYPGGRRTDMCLRQLTIVKLMSTSESTCWTVIQALAAGGSSDREELARRYLGVVRAYLAVAVAGVAAAGRSGRRRPGSLRRVLSPGACWRPRRLVTCPASAPFSTASSATSPAASRAGPSAPPTRCRTIATDEESQSRLFERTWAQCASWPRRPSCNGAGGRGGPEAVQRIDCCGCDSRRTCPSGPSPSFGRRCGSACTTPMPWPDRSSGPPSSRSWPFISPAARPRRSRRRRAS